MKFTTAPLLALLVFTSSAFAADSEVEQLRAQVQVLREVVAQLTARVDILEGKAATLTQASQSKPFTKPKTESMFYKQLPYVLGKVVPTRRAIQKHSFAVKSLKVELAKITNEVILTVALKVQNYSNRDWHTGQDKYTLRLKDTDLKGSLYSKPSLKKRERGTVTVKFRTKEFEAQEARMSIESKDKTNSGNVEFKLDVRNGF
ncbi:MAG: hypothetical protein JKX85_12035 [Phycisphaeraceae bacterium]|nr:hypothetical protein [Phycisphaeraceae bacterium]